MKIDYTERVRKRIKDLPKPVRHAFFKQVRFLEQDLHHPSLRAKKYDAIADIWQGRVNKDWRFYFQIRADIYFIVGIIPHPK